MKPLPGACSALIASLLLASPLQAQESQAQASQAQEQEITAEDVESYVAQIRGEAAEMMQTEDPQELIAWARNNFAEGATFQVSLIILDDDELEAYSSMNLDSGEILRMSGVLAGAFGQGVFEDYSLEADVGDVTPHWPGAATAEIAWTERFTFNPAGLAGDGGQGSQGEGMDVVSTADCTHLLQRQGDRLQIGLTTCTIMMRL